MPMTALRHLLAMSLIPITVAMVQWSRRQFVLWIAVLYGLASAALFGLLALVSVDPDDLASNGPFWTEARLRMLAAATLGALAALFGSTALVRRSTGREHVRSRRA